MRYYDAFPPYVPVAQRRAKAEKRLRQMQKKNPHSIGFSGRPISLRGEGLLKA